MDIFALIGAFGGGIVGAYLGALPVFILTGALAIAGAVVAMAGGADVTIGYVAFGSYLGPHVAFAGGVAAAAYAGKKKLIKSGTDILSPLYGLSDPMTLVVGGAFGVLGFVIHYFTGSVLRLNTDLPGITVIISALIARFAFGSSGLTGKVQQGEKRAYMAGGKELFCLVLLGAGIGTATGFVYQTMAAAGVSEAAIGSFPVLCFGIAGFSLMFTQTGFAVPSTHHIALVSALAAVLSGNPLMGVVFGILTALFGDFAGRTFNSYCDTHVDPPACTIFVFTFLVNILFGNGFFLP